MSKPVPLTMINMRRLVRNAEAKSDESLIAKLELMKQMLRVRQTEAVPSPHVGQDGIIRIAKAIQADVTSQNDLFRTHNALTRAGHEIFADLPHDDTEKYALNDVGEVATG